MPWLITRTLTMTLTDEEVERERADDETTEECVFAIAAEALNGDFSLGTEDTTVERVP